MQFRLWPRHESGCSSHSKDSHAADPRCAVVPGTARTMQHAGQGVRTELATWRYNDVVLVERRCGARSRHQRQVRARLRAVAADEAPGADGPGPGLRRGHVSRHGHHRREDGQPDCPAAADGELSTGVDQHVPGRMGRPDAGDVLSTEAASFYASRTEPRAVPLRCRLSRYRQAESRARYRTLALGSNGYC